jgi:hypothetical protein
MPYREAPEYWHKQAHRTRQVAAMVSLARDKIILLEMAENYGRQAKAAEERMREQQEQALLDAQLRLHRAAVGVLMRVARERRVAIKESRELIVQSSPLYQASPLPFNDLWRG